MSDPNIKDFPTDLNYGSSGEIQVVEGDISPTKRYDNNCVRLSIDCGRFSFEDNDFDSSLVNFRQRNNSQMNRRQSIINARKSVSTQDEVLLSCDGKLTIDEEGRLEIDGDITLSPNSMNHPQHAKANYRLSMDDATRLSMELVKKKIIQDIGQDIDVNAVLKVIDTCKADIQASKCIPDCRFYREKHSIPPSDPLDDSEKMYKCIISEEKSKICSLAHHHLCLLSNIVKVCRGITNPYQIQKNINTLDCFTFCLILEIIDKIIDDLSIVISDANTNTDIQEKTAQMTYLSKVLLDIFHVMMDFDGDDRISHMIGVVNTSIEDSHYFNTCIDFAMEQFYLLENVYFAKYTNYLSDVVLKTAEKLAVGDDSDTD